jgi:CubicO group peptidase (beta-lactamase class C family)
LDEGKTGRHLVLPPAAIRYLTKPMEIDPCTYRTYGMVALSTYSSPKGDLLPFGSFGHTGYTGSSLWVDPESHTVVILLTAGVTDRTRKRLVELRKTVANLIMGVMEPIQ